MVDIVFYNWLDDFEVVDEALKFYLTEKYRIPLKDVFDKRIPINQIKSKYISNELEQEQLYHLVKSIRLLNTLWDSVKYLYFNKKYVEEEKIIVLIDIITKYLQSEINMVDERRINKFVNERN